MLNGCTRKTNSALSPLSGSSGFVTGSRPYHTMLPIAGMSIVTRKPHLHAPSPSGVAELPATAAPEAGWRPHPRPESECVLCLENKASHGSQRNGVHALCEPLQIERLPIVPHQKPEST